MAFTNQGEMSFMSMLFMLYLTDYAGIGTMGATHGTVLLLVGRIFDTVDDPVQGWIVDRAKPRKLGKYRKDSVCADFSVVWGKPDKVCFISYVETCERIICNFWIIIAYSRA